MLCTVNDAAVVKVVEIVPNEVSMDDFVWIHMGSLGIKEQVLATDQDNALIFVKTHPMKCAVMFLNHMGFFRI
jgi:signal-transduction protein with cAMP-binding, CBS, and nucleotidyltransferase domain